MSYCSTADIRAITNLTTTDISDSDLNSLISYATYQINADIGATMYVKLGDGDYFTGDFDGTTTTFALKFCPIGDMDNDGSVGTTDVNLWYKLNTEDYYTKASGSISTIDDHEMGKFTFITAPLTTSDYIIKYVWFPIPYNSNLIKKACAELTAYLAFLRCNLKDIESYKLGKMEVSKVARHPGLVSFYDRYQDTLSKIRGYTLFRPIKWEMVEKMAQELEESLTQSGAGISGYLAPGEKP